MSRNPNAYCGIREAGEWLRPHLAPGTKVAAYKPFAAFWAGTGFVKVPEQGDPRALVHELRAQGVSLPVISFHEAPVCSHPKSSLCCSSRWRRNRPSGSAYCGSFRTRRMTTRRWFFDCFRRRKGDNFAVGGAASLKPPNAPKKMRGTLTKACLAVNVPDPRLRPGMQEQGCRCVWLRLMRLNTRD